MFKNQKKNSAIIFFIILFVLPLATLFFKKESFSEIENRNLALFPKFKAENIKNKSYMNDLDKYISDHFIERSNWVKAKVSTEILAGKKEINGVFISNNMLIQKINTPDYEKVDRAIYAINQFADENKANVYVMFVPTAGGIYTDELPENVLVPDQKKFIEYMYSLFNENVTAIDVYNTLYAVRDQYIYYRNDHHWTTYGAYCAYKTAIKRLGFSPVTYNKFNIEHASGEFRGSLYSKTLYGKITPDTIDLYNYEKGAQITDVAINDGMEEKSYNSMYFRDYLEKKDKYQIYLNGNNPLAKINTDVKNGKKLLVIKDSYANCFIPFLAQHYSEITVLDLRFIRSSYNNIVDMDEYGQVLILYNAGTMENDDTIKVLSYK